MSQSIAPIDQETLNFLTDSLKRHLDYQLISQLQEQLKDKHKSTSQLLNYVGNFWQKFVKLANNVIPCISERYSFLVDTISKDFILQTSWMIQPDLDTKSSYLSLITTHSKMLVGCSQILFRLHLLKGVCILKNYNKAGHEPQAIVKDLHKILSFCRCFNSSTQQIDFISWLDCVLLDIMRNTNCAIFVRSLKDLAERAELQDILEEIKRKEDSQEVRDMLKRGEDIKPSENTEDKQKEQKIKIRMSSAFQKVNEIIIEERSQTGIKVKPKDVPLQRHFKDLRRKSFIKPALHKVHSQPAPEKLPNSTRPSYLIRLSTMTNVSETEQNHPSSTKSLVLASETPIRKKQSKPE